MDENLAPVTRRDFEELAAQLREEMEGVVSAVAERAPAHGHDVLSDVLGQLRILKWGAGFALAAIMGGFGFLYQGQVELGKEIRELRQETYREISALRGDIADLSERVARLETGQTYLLRRLDELVPRDRAAQPNQVESNELAAGAAAGR